MDSYSSKYFQVVNKILEIHNFTRVIFYCNEIFKESMMFERFTMLNTIKPAVILTNFIEMHNFNFEVKYNQMETSLLIIVPFINENPESDLSMHYFRGDFQQYKLVVLVSSSRTANLSNIRKLLETQLIYQVLLLYDGLLLKFENFISHSGFVELNLEDLEEANFQAMKGYLLGNPVYLDYFEKTNSFPLIFEIKDSFSGKLGYFNLEFMEFVNKKLAPMNYGIGNLSIVSLEQLIQPMSGFVSNSYPVMSSRYCVMAPMVHLLPTYMYSIQSFHWKVWIVIWLGVPYIALVISVVFEDDAFTSARKALGFTSFTYLEPVSVGARKQRLFVCMFLWIYGFIMSNFLNVRLYSFLTTLNYGHQIRTIQDLLESSTKILTNDSEIYYFSTELKDTYVYTTNPEAFEKAMQFNTSYAYFVYDYQWELFKISQSLLKRKLFTYTSICSLTQNQVIISMIPPMLHWDDAKRYTLMVHRSGLLDIWERKAFYDGKAMRFYKIWRDNDDVRRPLTLDYFRIAWIFLLCGTVVGACAFLREVYI